MSLLVLADGWVPRMRVAPIPATVALPGLDSTIPVLEIPMRDLWTDTRAMLRATHHGHPLINGFSGYTPTHYDALSGGIGARDRSVIASLRELGPLVVLVNKDADVEGLDEAFVSGADDAHLMYRTPVGPVYRFPAAAPVAAQADVKIVPIAGISASLNVEAVAAMTDGAIATRWTTNAPQALGDEVTITLDGEVAVSRLEMDLGEKRVDYPRGLRVDVRTADGQLATVWNAGTAGPAMLAAMKDRLRIPLAIDFPAGTRAHTITLALTAADPEFRWAIAELRVFGR